MFALCRVRQCDFVYGWGAAGRYAHLDAEPRGT